MPNGVEILRQVARAFSNWGLYAKVWCQLLHEEGWPHKCALKLMFATFGLHDQLLGCMHGPKNTRPHQPLTSHPYSFGVDWMTSWSHPLNIEYRNDLMNRSRNDSHLGPLLPAGTWAQVIGIQFGISRHGRMGQNMWKQMRIAPFWWMSLVNLCELDRKHPSETTSLRKNDEKHMETWCTSQPTIQD